MNRAISPQVTQVMAASTVTAVQSRIEAGKACGGQDPSYNVASHQSLAGLMQTVSDGLRDGRLPVERLLGGSSFVLPLNTTDDGSKDGLAESDDLGHRGLPQSRWGRSGGLGWGSLWRASGRGYLPECRPVGRPDDVRVPRARLTIPG